MAAVDVRLLCISRDEVDGMHRAVSVCLLLCAIGERGRAQLPAQQTSVVGGSGGSAFTRDCGPGRVLTGIRGREGMQIDAIGILCAPVLSSGQLGPTSTQGTLAGGSGGQFKELRCASGAVVVRLEVNYGTILNQIVVGCRPWNASTRKFEGATESVFEIGSLRLQDPWLLLTCEAKTQPGAGIRGRSGLLVDAIGLICDEP